MAAQQLAINAGVANEHLQASAEGFADNSPIFHIDICGERHPIRERPSAALARHCAELVGDGETLFVRGNHRDEKFAGELVPEVIEEILHGPADAPVVVGRTEHDDIRSVDSRLQFLVAGQVVRGVRIVKGEGLLFEIEDIDGAASRLELVSDVMDNGTRHRIALETANDRQDV